MRLLEFKRCFDLEGCYIENIGDTLYQKKLIITMNCTQGASNDLNKGIVNLIFDEVKILVNKPLEFSFGCNKVLSFDCEEIGVGTTKAIFNFDSKEGSVEFVFLAQSLEVEYLNPYLIFDSSEFE